jgi:serine O-acetyltransferase
VTDNQQVQKMTIRDQLNKALHLIKLDLYRYTGEISWKAFARTYIREPGFNFMVWLRIRSVLESKIVGYILHTKRIKFGIDIQSFFIGEGFYIGHFGHIVVNSSAVIGKNCNISQGVTIGIANTGSKKGVPVVGDYVYIGPGAKILGNINIGNYAAIGANSVVVNDVPENGVVVGIPARVVSYDGSVGYINRVLEIN